jgi:hypothetical protein
MWENEKGAMLPAFLALCPIIVQQHIIVIFQHIIITSQPTSQLQTVFAVPADAVRTKKMIMCKTALESGLFCPLKKCVP